ncbi:hypothetical protein ACFQX4_21975 [Roseomonas sp. GCM10028921]
MPWIPVAASQEFSTFKWAEWVLSLGLDVWTVCLPPSSPSAALRDAVLPLTVHDHVERWPGHSARRAGQATIGLHGGRGGLDEAERALRRTLARDVSPALRSH